MLTESQIRRLFAIAHENGWTNDHLKQFLKKRYKIDKTSNLTLPNYEFLCSILKTSKPSHFGIV